MRLEALINDYRGKGQRHACMVQHRLRPFSGFSAAPLDTQSERRVDAEASIRKTIGLKLAAIGS